MIVLIIIGVVSFIAGLIMGIKKPHTSRASFHEPTNEMAYIPRDPPSKSSVIFAKSLTPHEAFKESKTISEFISKLK